MNRNIFNKIPVELPDELFTVLDEGSGTRIERIVSAGHASPEGFWHDQEENEWVILLSGSAVLSIDNESGINQVALRPGDYRLIPAHQRHRVESTSQTEKTIWLAVYYSPPAAPGV